MFIPLPHKIELNEDTSVALRNQIIRDHYTHKDDWFAQVIFNGMADIEIDMKIPTCDLTPIDSDRFKSILGHNPDVINDHLHDFNYLSQLSDDRIHELKDLLRVNLLSECMEYTLFLDTNTCCKTNQLSKTTKRKKFTGIPFPKDQSYLYCWLQILPLVQAYPRTYLPPLTQEYEITQVRVCVSDCTLITEQAGDTSFYIDMIKRGADDPYSVLYGNQTDFDIKCIFNQCETFLSKLKTQNVQSYRIRFIQFIVYYPKARLPYLAKKLTQLSHEGNLYLWYL